MLILLYLVQYNNIKLHFKKFPSIDYNASEYFSVSVHEPLLLYIFIAIHAVVDLNNIKKFQGIQRIFTRNRARADELLD